jgi:hypothetical protein
VLELVPALRPASITFQCADDERAGMVRLLEELQRDRRVVEAKH